MMRPLSLLAWSCALLLGCNAAAPAREQSSTNNDVAPEPAQPEPPPIAPPPIAPTQPEPAPTQPPPDQPEPLPPFASARLHHDGPVVDIAWSADGLRLATCSDDGALRLWDANTHALVHTFSAWPAPPRHVALSRDAAIITAHAALELRVFDGLAGTLRHTLQHEAPTTAVALTPDGATVLSAGQDGLRSWSTTDGSPRHHLTQRSAQPLSLAIIDEHTALSAWTDGKLRRIDLERGRVVGKPIAVGVDAKLERLAHDGGRFVFLDGDGHLQVWQLDTAKLMTRGEQLTPLTLGMMGNLMLVTAAPGPSGHAISVADVHSGAIAREFFGHAAPVLAAVFSPDGARFASGSAAGEVLIWAAP